MKNRYKIFWPDRECRYFVSSLFLFLMRNRVTRIARRLLLLVVASVTFASSVFAASGDDAKKDDNLFKVAEIDFPETNPLLGFIDSRKMQSLNGNWQYVIDPMGAGTPGGFMNYTGGVHNDDGMTLVEYDFENSSKIRVPGDFNTQDERLFFYQGWVWFYKKIAKQQLAKDEKLHLWFGGVNFYTEVFINGKPGGKHTGGYVPFSFDITDLLTKESNELIVRVNSSLDTESVPTFRTDWWPYGGLIRDAALIVTPKEYIVNAKVSLADNTYEEINVAVETRGMVNAPVQVLIPELGVDIAAETDAAGNASIRIPAKPELWSPDSPKLYAVNIRAGDDVISDSIGFKRIESRDGKIWLNGKAVKFKGISTHEEPVGEKGVAYSEEHIGRLLSEAKQLGVNFVRAAHYPYSRHMAKVADRLGIMLWEEIPVYWNISWENPETLKIARDQMSRLVRRDWNRSSVAVWSVANETPYSKPRMAFLSTLINDVREMDNSRLVSAALLGGTHALDNIAKHIAAKGAADTSLSLEVRGQFSSYLAQQKGVIPAATDHYNHVIDDPLGELCDIVSYNEYFGWYYAAILRTKIGVTEAAVRKVMFDHMADMTISSVYKKPIHISEFGAGAKAGRKGGEALLWTEEYQAKVYASQTSMLAQSPEVQGMTPWILKDFRAMLRTLPGIQDYYNRKGLMSPEGERKQAYYILQDFYQKQWK